MLNQEPTDQGGASSRFASPSMEPTNPGEPKVLYPLQDISLMVKSYSHDLRNTLNGMDLDLTLLSEAHSDSNIQEAIQRLQVTASEIGRQVQGLIAKYGMETPFLIPAVQLVERWQLDARLLEAPPPLHWSIKSCNALIYGEAGLIRNLLWEMLLMSQRICPRKSLHLTYSCRGSEAFFKVVVEELPSEPRRVQLQQMYWQALRRLAERANGRLLPTSLEENQPLSLQLILPTQPLATPEGATT